MNQWRTQSQYCAKGRAWITGSSSVKATSGWQLQAASCSPRHSSAGTVASPRNRALGTPRRCSRLTEWRRPCAGRESMSRRPTTIGWLSLRPLTKKGACSRLAQSPPASRPNPTGSVSHAPRLRPASAPQAARTACANCRGYRACRGALFLHGHYALPVACRAEIPVRRHHHGHQVNCD